MRNDDATSTRAGATPDGRWMGVLRHLDVVLLLLATPLALALGTPTLGFVVGAAAWVGQRVLAKADRRLIRQAKTPSTRLGLSLFEAFGRIWLLAGAIVAAGVIGGRADGLAAALTIFGAYSVAFAVKVIDGAPRGPQPASPAGPQPGSRGRREVVPPARGRTA